MTVLSVTSLGFCCVVSASRLVATNRGFAVLLSVPMVLRTNVVILCR